MAVFAATVFLSAFLLFQIQPLIAKVILPWFGGAPNVWTTCMLFFQVVLLGGYLYAHLVTRFVRPAAQWIVHGVLLGVSVALLNIIPGDAWKPTASGSNVMQILLVLSVSIGLPYFLLSTTGPLIQAAFARRYQGRSPYRLFALSNLGSLLALVSFPFVFEPVLPTGQHAVGWGWAYIAFVALCVGALYLARRSAAGWPAAATAPTASQSAPVSSGASAGGEFLWWLALSLVPSVLLLATTNHLCHSVAVLPFLWIAPLALYLLSFIICFEKPHWYRRDVWSLVMFIGMAFSILAAYLSPAEIVMRVVLYLFAMFAASMACHGELAVMRPAAARLTWYYLVISLGGALGGVFVVLVAPRFFNAYHELPLAYIAASVLFAWRLLASGDARTIYRLALLASWTALLLGLAMLVNFPEYLKTHALERYTLLGGLWFAALTGLAHRRAEFSAMQVQESALGSLRLNGPLLVAIFGLLMAITALLVLVPVLPEYALDFGGFVISLWAVFLAGCALIGNGQWMPAWRNASWISVGFVLLSVAVGTAYWGRQIVERRQDVIYQSRDFFGVMSITEQRSDTWGILRIMLNGKISHGMQYLKPDLLLRRTTYFADQSGVGLCLNHHPRRESESLKIGVIGLGTGTIAIYARPGDELIFYEIKPDCERAAREYFTYLSDNPAADRTSVVLGDARMVLEREMRAGKSEQFDILVVDAFSGDSPPRHLLTRESLAVYRHHLKADGLIAFNISNGFLELHRVVLALANEVGWQARWFHFRPNPESLDELSLWESLWVVVTNNETFLNHPLVVQRQESWEGVQPVLWTDDFGGLWQVFKLHRFSWSPASWFGVADN